MSSGARPDPKGQARGGREPIGGRAALALAFASSALRYWLHVFPSTSIALRGLRVRARRIPDPALRALTLEGLAKRSNVEGAAAFAAHVPLRHRGRALRALIAFQAAYNHVDLLAERLSANPVDDSRCLHEALLEALAGHADASSSRLSPTLASHDDGGYLTSLVRSCREALRRLPSYTSVAPAARAAAERIVAFQSLSLGPREDLERWARELPVRDGLEWWESAAAGGSSLTVCALVAAAAERSLASVDATALERAYLSSIGALHSLLDSLVDRAEDAETRQLSLVGCYPDEQFAAARMRALTRRSLASARALPGGRRHTILVTAMACSYLCAPEISDGGDCARAVREELGRLGALVMLVFRIRRLAGRAAEAASGARRRGTSAAGRLQGRRGADAGAA